MYSFGRNSMKVYETLHPELQSLMSFLIQYVDFSLVSGLRMKEEQEELFAKGATTIHFPRSRHNGSDDPKYLLTRSDAGDVVPYVKGLGQVWPNPKTDSPTEYREKLKIFSHLMGMVRLAGLILEIPIRLGYDWDGDFNTLDQSFHDLPHIERRRY